MNDEEIRLSSGDGGEIFVAVDRPVGTPVGRVILVPPFGMGGERMFPVSYLLTLNGFEVFRFDPRCSPGRSSGVIAEFTLSGLNDDLSTVFSHVPNALVVAISLSARSVLRTLAEREDWRAAVLMTPVVNARYTLHQVFGFDIFGRKMAGELGPDIRVLGLDMKTSFLDNCMSHGLMDAAGATSDLTKCRHPIALVAGDADPWVKIDEVREAASAAQAAGRSVEVVSVQAASHQLYRNPVLALTYFQAATRECLRLIGKDPASAVSAPFSQIIAAVEDTTSPARASGTR